MKTIIATNITGGNPKEKRSKNDYYPTPPEVTTALLDYLDLPKSCVIWEPACGENDMVEAIKNRGYSVIGTDIIYGYDFLKEPLYNCDWIITNPPFTLSDQFIEKCAKYEKPFALLLKSQYWHAKKRYNVFLKYPPTVICPLTWRPDFNFKTRRKKNASPLMDVMWCIWIPPYTNKTIYEPLTK